jgi:hypothetical protein
MKKMQYTHIPGCAYADISAMKRNEALTHAPRWMKLEHTMLGEISQPGGMNIV